MSRTSWLRPTNPESRTSNLRPEKKAISEKPKEEAPAKKEMKLPALAVNEFRITKGKVTYRDGRSGKTMVVALESLTAAVTGPGEPCHIETEGGL